MSSDLVLCLAGRAAAGKSTLAEALVERLGWPSASFGDYVRAQARARSLGANRETLQDLGAQLIETYGWDGFCRRTLAERASILVGPVHR